jgi:hypothetical protein
MIEKKENTNKTEQIVALKKLFLIQIEHYISSEDEHESMSFYVIADNVHKAIESVPYLNKAGNNIRLANIEEMASECVFKKAMGNILIPVGYNSWDNLIVNNPQIQETKVVENEEKYNMIPLDFKIDGGIFKVYNGKNKKLIFNCTKDFLEDVFGIVNKNSKLCSEYDKSEYSLTNDKSNKE